MKDKLVKFIKENKIQFKSIGSGLNSQCTVLCGYADYISADKETVLEAVKEVFWKSTFVPEEVKKELFRVFDFAYIYNYGNWWKREEASKTYKF